MAKTKVWNGTAFIEVPTKWGDIEEKPTSFEPASHNHSASHITSGTLNAARIPQLAPSKIQPGSESQVLKVVSGVPTWAADETGSNNYLTGVSGSGNGSVTFTRTGLSNLSWNAAHTHSGFNQVQLAKNLHVGDARKSNEVDGSDGSSGYLPEPGSLSKEMQPIFSTGFGGSSWRSGILNKGWSGSYAAWSLSGPAGSSTDDDYHLQSGVNTSWGTPRRIWHSGDFSSTAVSNWDTAHSRSVTGVSGSGNSTLTISREGTNVSTNLAHTHPISQVTNLQTELDSKLSTVNLTVTTSATSNTVTNTAGSNATIAAATASVAGIMTAADKDKLDGVETGAEANLVTSVAGKTGAITLAVGDVSNAVATSRTISAGNGLSGGGSLASNRTITLGTPSTITGSTNNSTTSTSHTHNINLNASDVGAYTTGEMDTALNEKLNTSGGTMSGSINFNGNGNIQNSTSFGFTNGRGITVSGGNLSWIDNAMPVPIYNQNNKQPVNLDMNRGAVSVSISTGTGYNATIPAATSSLAGVMTSSDKSKLDNVESWTEVKGASITTIGTSGADITDFSVWGRTDQTYMLEIFYTTLTTHNTRNRTIVPITFGSDSVSSTHSNNTIHIPAAISAASYFDYVTVGIGIVTYAPGAQYMAFDNPRRYRVSTANTIAVVGASGIRLGRVWRVD